MKRLLIVALALISIQGIAQERKERKERPNRQEKAQRMSDLTPDEAATLQTKKMALHLDLNDSQQKQIYKLNLENAVARKDMMKKLKAKKESGELEKPTKEDRLKMMNTRLDHQIATKAKIKTILSKEQFDKWEKVQEKMHQRAVGMKKHNGKIKGENLKKQ